MTLEVHVDFRGEALRVGTLHTPSRGTSADVENAPLELPAGFPVPEEKK